MGTLRMLRWAWCSQVRPCSDVHCVDTRCAAWVTCQLYLLSAVRCDVYVCSANDTLTTVTGYLAGACVTWACKGAEGGAGVFAGSSDPATRAAMKAIEDEAQQERVEASREAAKLAKKAEFDSKYDGGGSRAVDKVGGGSDDEEDATAANDGDTQEKKKGKGWALYAPLPPLHA